MEASNANPARNHTPSICLVTLRLGMSILTFDQGRRHAATCVPSSQQATHPQQGEWTGTASHCNRSLERVQPAIDLPKDGVDGIKQFIAMQNGPMIERIVGVLRILVTVPKSQAELQVEVETP